MITFVGDVHGWIKRLDTILADAEGEVVFIGDLIDRGPDSRGVIARVRSLVADGRARCVMGNHEYAAVRGIGVPSLGIEPTGALFDSWYQFYGGERTAASYGVTSPDPQALQSAMREDLEWMAQLPWVLEGSEGARQWIAVHAGLSEDPLELQLADLRDVDQWWLPDADLPFILYVKEWVATVPCDLPDDVTVVSGHVPLEKVYRTANRLAIDTSGGLENRPLSAVVWPQERIISVAT